MEYKALTTEQRELDVRTLALSFGVLSQVRVARQNIDEVYRRFELDDRVYKSYKEHLENVRARFGKGGEVARLDIDRLELETVETEIIRIQALGNCYMAYFRLLNTLGMRPTSFENTNKQFAAIKLALDNELPMCLGMHYVRDDGTIVFNGIDFENSLSGNERGILDEFSENGFRMKKLPPPLTFPIDEKLLRAKVEARVKDSIKTFLAADSERETIVPTGEVKADGSIVFNGVEFKGEPTMSDSERAALERLDRAPAAAPVTAPAPREIDREELKQNVSSRVRQNLKKYEQTVSSESRSGAKKDGPVTFNGVEVNSEASMSGDERAALEKIGK
jgi:hypothetical protein